MLVSPCNIRRSRPAENKTCDLRFLFAIKDSSRNISAQEAFRERKMPYKSYPQKYLYHHIPTLIACLHGATQEKILTLEKKIAASRTMCTNRTDGSYQHGATSDPKLQTIQQLTSNLTQNPKSSNTVNLIFKIISPIIVLLYSRFVIMSCRLYVWSSM